ncbi:MAG: hypothetical protein PVF38_09875 [Desulfobacterales bacterium]|jgi:hypothetical protein
MKIAFIHYHLKTGGVTTCLKQQLKALKSDCDMCVITGELPPNTFPVKTIHVPELAYSSVYHKPYVPEKVAATVIEKIWTHFDGPCDIVHVHNPLLAKNSKFLRFLKLLQQKGLNLLLQAHDFAEDGRARLYFHEDYPVDCHYCVVNSRDYKILRKCGLKKQGLHQLFNCVSLPQLPPDPVAEKPYVVYPIRAIRRKNIGEAILLSLFFDPGERLAITLPPNSAADMVSYEAWKAFAADYRLPIEFDRGLDTPFETIVCSARYLLTTSITEGFGFSFLEPWLYHKYVSGRKLDDICNDFEIRGIDLNHMYSQLMVPLKGFDANEFYSQWSRTIMNTARIFNIQIDAAQIRRAYETITEGGLMDFGLLAEPYQKQVLHYLMSNKTHLQKLLTRNPLLSEISNGTNQKNRIEGNRNAIVRSYNMAQYRQTLLDLYARVVTTPVKQRINKKTLLAEFFDLKRFSLLKWGEDDPQ